MSRELQPCGTRAAYKRHPDDAHRAPCVANPRLWDPRGEDESAADARRRYRVAAEACRTECPVFVWCDANAPRVAGVVAGVVL